MTLRTGRVVLGTAIAGAGAACLAFGLVQPALVPWASLPASAPAMVDALGVLLLVWGVLMAVLTFRPKAEEVSIVPAHVAFVSRAPRPVGLPERPAIPAGQARAAPRARADHPGMSKLDDEIRDLTRLINKAGVMLATGQISHQGYTSYVQELKQRRGALEASRVRLELRSE